MTDQPESPPDNPMAGLAGSWQASRANRSKLDRLVEVATTLHEPTRVSEVADRAECSPNFARDKLELLTALGILVQVSAEPATYRRDEAHFRRLRARRLLEEHEGDIEAVIAQYRDRNQELQAHFGVDSPAAVPAAYFDQFEDPATIASERDTLATWQTVRDRLVDLQRANAMAATGDGVGLSNID